MSSAYDLARLIAYASADERIGGIMRKTSYSTHVGKRTITANSTNQLVKSGDIDVLGGKTGFISRSGYCLATLLRLPQTGQQVAVVVLGAKIERQPLLGNAPPVQLDEFPHARPCSTATVQQPDEQPLTPRATRLTRHSLCITAASSGSVDNRIRVRQQRAVGVPRVERLDVAAARPADHHPVHAVGRGHAT